MATARGSVLTVPRVVINEVMANPRAVSDERGEWIELVNLEAKPLDLRGWQIASENDVGAVIDRSVSLPASGIVVLARDGEAATGSPWWVDSLNVAANESYDVAFVADNPGIWMDHCHNLKHASDGMVAHLMYEGFDTPYRIAGPADNRPE